MPLMNETQALATHTTDARNARLIGILMCHAKALQTIHRKKRAGATEEQIQPELDALLQSAAKLTGGDGRRLEKDVIALGRDLGFVIEQEFLQ